MHLVIVSSASQASTRYERYIFVMNDPDLLLIESLSTVRYMLARRALASATAIRTSSTALRYTATAPSASAVSPRQLRAVPVNRHFTSTARAHSLQANPIITTDNITNMGGKGLLIAVKPDGTAYSSSSSSEALSSLGLESSSLSALWKSSNAKPRPAEVRLFYGMGSSKDITVALVGVGKVEGLDQDALLERTRAVAATGVKALREVGCTEVSSCYICTPE